MSASNYNTYEQVKSDIVPVDAGIIRCICPSIEDDGFTIQCEKCYVWQHAYCVNITHATIPDHYVCDRCASFSLRRKPSTSSLVNNKNNRIQQQHSQQSRKGPKMSKRISMSRKNLHRLDAIVEESSEHLMNETKKKKKRAVKSRVVSRFVHSIFREARDRWMSSQRWKEYLNEAAAAAAGGTAYNGHGPLLYDHGPFVTMDATTLYTKGVLLDAPVSSKGLFAARPIPALRYLLEVTGDVMLKSEFKFDPINDYVILGTPLSHIMFYPTLDLCIDTRQFGNKARYIRRSCHPNAELRNVILPFSKDDKTIHLGLFAKRAIEKGEEVTVGWNWQRGHIAWKESMNWHYRLKEKSLNESHGNQVIDEEEERRRKTTIKALLTRFEKEFGVCACVNKRKCLVQYLKRQCATPRDTSQRRKSSVPSITTLKNGRRKSSVILLKPKPLLKSNSGVNASIVTVKKDNNDLSDDEFLDIEGDIDVGEDALTAIATAPPLTEDNSGEEDHDDLSSLSSLSSLSVYDDAAEENLSGNIDRNRSHKSITSKDSLKRKAMDDSFYPNKSLRSANSKSADSFALQNDQQQNSPTTTKDKMLNLPRKKLWTLNYMTTAQTSHSNESVAAPTLIDSKDANPVNKSLTVSTTSVQQKDTLDDRKIEERIEVDTVDPASAIDVVTVSDDQTTDGASGKNSDSIAQLEDDCNKDALQHVTSYETSIIAHQQTFSTSTHSNTSLSTIEPATNISKTSQAADRSLDEMDIDEGELSDASTVQLDDDEIKEIYQRQDNVGVSFS